MPVNEEDVVNIMGGMPEGIRLNDHRRRLKNRQKHTKSDVWWTALRKGRIEQKHNQCHDIFSFTMKNLIIGLNYFDGCLQIWFELFWRRFELCKKLGQGTYGKVQLGINKETGQRVRSCFKKYLFSQFQKARLGRSQFSLFNLKSKFYLT